MSVLANACGSQCAARRHGIDGRESRPPHCSIPLSFAQLCVCKIGFRPPHALVRAIASTAPDWELRRNKRSD